MDHGETRFIFITGGVVSSLGKGIAAASIGRLLVARGEDPVHLGVEIAHGGPFKRVGCAGGSAGTRPKLHFPRTA